MFWARDEFKRERASVETRIPRGSALGQNQSIWKVTSEMAGASGGGRVGSPRHSRILWVVSGGWMAARIFIAPPQISNYTWSELMKRVFRVSGSRSRMGFS